LGQHCFEHHRTSLSANETTVKWVGGVKMKLVSGSPTDTNLEGEDHVFPKC
jgi:hypothetical protein